MANGIGRDHFLARFRDILAFFCKKSHQNSRSEKKNRTLNFSHFAPLSSYFAHAVHFKTIGLLCLTGFWIIVAPKFVPHTTAGNHSLICIIEKLYRKSSLSVSSLSKRFLSPPRVSKNMSADSEKIKEKIIRPKAVQSGWQHVKLSCSTTLSSPDSNDNQTRPSWAWITIPLPSSWSPFSAVCILLRARRNDKEMKVKPATSFKIIYSIYW